MSVDPPRIASAALVEGDKLTARRIVPTRGRVFDGFLDGTQSSRVVTYDGPFPIVHGTVAAVVRERVDRRFVTWGPGPLVDGAVYAPLAYLSPHVRRGIERTGVAIVDSSAPDEDGRLPLRHPIALLERAVHFVQADRERVERELAEAWCGIGAGTLFVDGGLQGSDMLATSGRAVGVVKSHRTLYVSDDAVGVLFALGACERSTVFRIAAARRAPVASWYLRLRDPIGHDPLWGLVRVEAAWLSDESVAALTDRADEISNWILAEVTPLALPDARWDKMVYPIRDCEAFLAAIV